MDAISSVASVRKLATCSHCHRLGMHQAGLVLVSFTADSRGRKRDKVHAHPRCQISAVGVTRFVADTMRLILKRFAKEQPDEL